MLQHRLTLDALEQLVVTPERSFPCQGSQLPSAPNSFLPTSHSMLKAPPISKTLHWQMQYFAFSTSWVFGCPTQTLGQAGSVIFPWREECNMGCQLQAPVPRLAFGQSGPQWSPWAFIEIPEHPRLMESRSQYLYSKRISSDCWRNALHFIHHKYVLCDICTTFWLIFGFEMSPKPIPCHFVLRSNSQRHPQSISVLCHLWTLPKLGHKKTALLRLAVSWNDSITSRHTSFMIHMKEQLYQHTYVYLLSTHIIKFTNKTANIRFLHLFVIMGNYQVFTVRPISANPLLLRRNFSLWPSSLQFHPISAHPSRSLHDLPQGKKRSNGRWEVYPKSRNCH